MSPRETFRVFVLAVTFPAAALAQSERLSSAETGQAAHALKVWLDDGDYDLHRLTSLAKHGQAVIPSLIAALDGPSPARRELMRRALEEEYAALERQARLDPERRIRSKADYVRHYLGNSETLYRVRAAQALAAIGGPSARKALEEALARVGREDLRRVFRSALDKIR